jgi:hypothetical protein
MPSNCSSNQREKVLSVKSFELNWSGGRGCREGAIAPLRAWRGFPPRVQLNRISDPMLSREGARPLFNSSWLEVASEVRLGPRRQYGGG